MNENDTLFVRNSRKSVNKLNEGDSSPNENDIWDDSLLIEAYDRAVNLAQQSLKKPDSDLPKNSKIRKKGGERWKVGDKCRCQYSEDLKFYEADIIQITRSTGMCLVRYVGYENEEEIPLKNLKPSGGESARWKQVHEAIIENEDDDVTVQIGQETVSPSRRKQSNRKFSKKEGQGKRRDNVSENAFPSLNFPFPQIENAMIPPPPPPHMFNQASEDENEAEAMSAMLISWYMSGYHTGYYQGLKMAKKN